MLVTGDSKSSENTILSWGALISPAVINISILIVLFGRGLIELFFVKRFNLPIYLSAVLTSLQHKPP